MSEEWAPSREVAWVEAELFSLLQDRGMEDPNTINWAMTDLLVNPKMAIETPAVSKLPDIYEESVREGLHTLNDLYPGVFPEDELAELEEEILGIIGLGLEGKVPGPMTAPSEVDVAGRDDPPHWAAKNLPETPFDPPEWWESEDRLTVEIEGGVEDLSHPETPTGPDAAADSDPANSIIASSMASKEGPEREGDVESSEEEPTNGALRENLEQLADGYSREEVFEVLIELTIDDIEAEKRSIHLDEIEDELEYLKHVVKMERASETDSTKADRDSHDQTQE